jgi:hypothetical protein
MLCSVSQGFRNLFLAGILRAVKSFACNITSSIVAFFGGS